MKPLRPCTECDLGTAFDILRMTAMKTVVDVREIRKLLHYVDVLVLCRCVIDGVRRAKYFQQERLLEREIEIVVGEGSFSHLFNNYTVIHLYIYMYLL